MTLQKFYELARMRARDMNNSKANYGFIIQDALRLYRPDIAEQCLDLTPHAISSPASPEFDAYILRLESLWTPNGKAIGTLHRIYFDASVRIMRGERRGQALFNALHVTKPELANQIRAGLLDPFYRDERIPAVIAWLEQELFVRSHKMLPQSIVDQIKLAAASRQTCNPEFANVLYVVRCAETHSLWECWHSKIHTWENMPSLLCEIMQIPSITGMMGCCVILNFIKIDGKMICSYEDSSQVVDHRVIRVFIDELFTGSRGHCDALNFNHALSALEIL